MFEAKAIPPGFQEAAWMRTEEQEKIFGRNGGQFVNDVDKGATLTGTLGEILVAEYFRSNGIIADLTDLGAPVDIHIQGELLTGAHVKTGRFKRWPEVTDVFYIHAHQNLEQGVHPIIVVTLVDNYYKIEGYLHAYELELCEIVEAIETLPKTRSRKTYFYQYRSIEDLVDIEEWIRA